MAAMPKAPGTGSRPMTPARPRRCCSCASWAPRCGRVPRPLRLNLPCSASSRRSCPRIPAAPRRAQALQQFSTPIALGFVAAVARSITPADVVLEPSAGTGLLAISPKSPAHRSSSTNLPRRRVPAFSSAVPAVSVTRFDAAHIHDHLDGGAADRRADEPAVLGGGSCRGTVVDAALRQSARRWRALPKAAVLSHHGRQSSPDTGLARGFVRLQERGRVVFSAAIDGRVYARQGTTRNPPDRDRPRAGRRSGGVSRLARDMAPDAATLLDWVMRTFRPRAPRRHRL